MTFLTLLVYLNDGFEDGHTRYWFDFGEIDSRGEGERRARPRPRRALLPLTSPSTNLPALAQPTAVSSAMRLTTTLSPTSPSLRWRATPSSRITW